MIGSGLPSLPKLANKSRAPCQALLTRIEQLIDQVRFDADGPSQKMRDKHLGKRWFVMEDADHDLLLQPHNLAFRHCRSRRHAARLAVQATFAAEFVRSQDRDDGFLSLLGNYGNFDLAVVDVKDRV